MGKEQDLLFNVADIVKRAKQVLNFKTGAERQPIWVYRAPR